MKLHTFLIYMIVLIKESIFKRTSFITVIYFCLQFEFDLCTEVMVKNQIVDLSLMNRRVFE